MSKTEQDLDASTDAALTDDAELIEVDATPEGLDTVDIDDEADEVAAPTTNGARTGPAGSDDTAEVELDRTRDNVEDLLDTDDDSPDSDDAEHADDSLDTVIVEVDYDDLDDTADYDAFDTEDARAALADTELPTTVEDIEHADDAETDATDTAPDVETDTAETDTAETDTAETDTEIDTETDTAETDTAETDTAETDTEIDTEIDTETDTDDTGTNGAAEVDDADDADDADDELVDDASNPFEIPPILIATEEDADDSGALDRVDDDDDHQQDHTPGGTPLAPPVVSRDILEELRQADIDGPIVEMAPQDDTTSARRRPKQPVDYDPAPVPIPLQVPRILGRKPRVRKVTRVVRHVDPWSVFKIAIIANMVLYLVVLTASVLLWNVAYATGTVDNVERFFESFGWQSFEFNGGEIYHSLWIAGLFIVLGLTGFAVLGATLFNLITDLVGGVRFTVLEEEVVESRTSPMRRFVVRRPEPEIPAVIQDPSGSIIREAIVDDTGDIAR